MRRAPPGCQLLVVVVVVVVMVVVVVWAQVLLEVVFVVVLMFQPRQIIRIERVLLLVLVSMVFMF